MTDSADSNFYVCEELLSESRKLDRMASSIETSGIRSIDECRAVMCVKSRMMYPALDDDIINKTIDEMNERINGIPAEEHREVLQANISIDEMDIAARMLRLLSATLGDASAGAELLFKVNEGLPRNFDNMDGVSRARAINALALTKFRGVLPQVTSGRR